MKKRPTSVTEQKFRGEKKKHEKMAEYVAGDPKQLKKNTL